MSGSGIWRGTIYGITAATIWGGMYVVSDVTLLALPPFTLLSLRILLGLTVLFPLDRAKGQPVPDGRTKLALLGVGAVGLGISLGAQFVGTDLSTAVNGALVTSASPAFVVLFALILLREKLTLARLASVALASAGVLVILDPAAAEFGSETFLGDVFLAIAAVTWGLYSVLVRRVTMRHSLPALTVTVYALFGGLLLSLPASLIELSQQPIGQVDASIVLGVLYLGLVSTAFALLLWNRAFALVPATVASLCFFAQPLSGAFLAALFLGQELTLTLWVGGGLIAAAVLLSLARAPVAASVSQ
ncbi:MAG: DMT family transporter [Chloroflexota bacterium]|nr:DMT family transporter [Chloroflexota bacterium]MDE2945946.1 DMT family transporter [Chloroflexota bacterium]